MCSMNQWEGIKNPNILSDSGEKVCFAIPLILLPPQVDQMSKGDVEFDVPFRELGFHGVPHRETVLLQPTTNCLVHLTNWVRIYIISQTLTGWLRHLLDYR